MKIKKNNGQEALEFVLITVLVFFSALTVVTIFGGKIANFFQSDSSVSKVSALKAKTISSTDKQKYDYVIEPVVIPKKKAAYSGPEGSYVKNSDGSYSAMINGESVNFASGILEAMNKAMETTGSDSTIEQIIGDVKYMSTKLGVSPTDIEIMFGKSQQNINVIRNFIPKQIGISGNADINMIALKYNGQILIRNKSLATNDDISGYFSPTLQLKIEGVINPDNTFTSSSFEASNDDRFSPTKGSTPSYNSPITIGSDGSLSFDNGEFDLKNKKFAIVSKTGAYNSFQPTGNLAMKFDNPNYRFSLK